eukprot:362944-Chlamydomonas_euryale.AAC.3
METVTEFLWPLDEQCNSRHGDSSSGGGWREIGEHSQRSCPRRYVHTDACTPKCPNTSTLTCPHQHILHPYPSARACRKAAWLSGTALLGRPCQCQFHGVWGRVSVCGNDKESYVKPDGVEWDAGVSVTAREPGRVRTGNTGKQCGASGLRS